MTDTRPARLILILTTRCNLSCSYCYQRVRGPRDMEWRVAKAGADLLLSMPGRGVELTFYGGEPLLEASLMRRVVDYVGRICRTVTAAAQQRHVQYWVVTNGLLITDELCDFFAEHEFRVLLSFDGVRAAQDLRGPGSFEVLDSVLETFRMRHPVYFRRGVEVSVTVPPTAVALLADSVEYLLAQGVQKIDLTPVMTPHPGWDEDCHHELETQFDRVRQASHEHLERTGEVPLLLYAGRGRLTGPPVTSRAMCEIVDGNSWAVDVDGTVAGCALYAPSVQEYGSELLRACRSTVTLGHVTDPGLPERLAAFPADVGRLPVFSEKEKKYSSYRRCADCRFFAVCVTCPASIGFAEGNTDPHRVPDYYCAFNYISLASRDGFPVQPTDLEVIRGDRYRELRLRWKTIGEEARREAAEREKREPRAGASGSTTSRC
jgi:sulfatase maturation enzyme AslB (radical SAM superfamily)